MDRISLGFVLAALYNICIVLFSKGFSGDLGAVDPLFGPGGCVGVLLWGLAYLSLARSYSAAPAVALVFALEKLFYGRSQGNSPCTDRERLPDRHLLLDLWNR